jgi:hypothetical protein
MCSCSGVEVESRCCAVFPVFPRDARAVLGAGGDDGLCRAASRFLTTVAGSDDAGMEELRVMIVGGEVVGLTIQRATGEWERERTAVQVQVVEKGCSGLSCVRIVRLECHAIDPGVVFLPAKTTPPRSQAQGAPPHWAKRQHSCMHTRGERPGERAAFILVSLISMIHMYISRETLNASTVYSRSHCHTTKMPMYFACLLNTIGHHA